ncbi:hypothetical protein BC937DRAFT_93091 [Endogone sp. FLAS-F59071]|nr:hypothetical protein BC937DRAFT_93091 [Endogone sp. FLAS-F59071]|eukprot:RUS21309.1 hypothetical protein BC937DRAFT_93091 [Endogone sp. FLAS-F59071]
MASSLLQYDDVTTLTTFGFDGAPQEPENEGVFSKFFSRVKSSFTPLAASPGLGERQQSTSSNVSLASSTNSTSAVPNTAIPIVSARKMSSSTQSSGSNQPHAAEFLPTVIPDAKLTGKPGTPHASVSTSSSTTDPQPRRDRESSIDNLKTRSVPTIHTTSPPASIKSPPQQLASPPVINPSSFPQAQSPTSAPISISIPAPNPTPVPIPAAANITTTTTITTVTAIAIAKPTPLLTTPHPGATLAVPTLLSPPTTTALKTQVSKLSPTPAQTYAAAASASLATAPSSGSITSALLSSTLGPTTSIPISRPGPRAAAAAAGNPTDDDSDTRSVMTTFSVSNSNSLGKVLRRLRGERVNRDYWMPDEASKECYECKAPFTMFRRKHHCRICGGYAGGDKGCLVANFFDIVK